MSEQVEYRNIRREDLPAVARVFLEAFPESIQHYIGHPIAPRVMADVFAIAQDAEPEAFFVAVIGGEIAGYVFAPAYFSRLPRIALFHGHLLRMLWRWLTGQYGIGLRPVLHAIHNWFLLLRGEHAPTPKSDARILSIAVRPARQGRKLGAGLMRVALAYLQRCRVTGVRLEVRPENAAAVHLYAKMGFVSDGHTRDTQGDWLIMFKQLRDDERH